MNSKILVLDAMGVLYQSCDDVEELLIPFIKAQNRACSEGAIRESYIRASLGEITLTEFWVSNGVNPELESQYLNQHRLTEGVIPFLESVKGRYDKCICLSNDVAEWSKYLRVHFGLEPYFDDWLISGDLGYRKPSKDIFRIVQERYGSQSEYTFIDDNPNNVKAAQEQNWNAILMNPSLFKACP